MVVNCVIKQFANSITSLMVYSFVCLFDSLPETDDGFVTCCTD